LKKYKTAVLKFPNPIVNEIEIKKVILFFDVIMGLEWFISVGTDFDVFSLLT